MKELQSTQENCQSYKKEMYIKEQLIKMIMVNDKEMFYLINRLGIKNVK